MKQHIKFFILVSLLAVFFLAGCEAQRPVDKAGDIKVPPPELVTPAVEPPPSTEESTSEPTEPGPADIDPEAVRASVAPDAAAVEPGTVLIKLTQQAAIQARSVELDSSGIVVAGIPSLDQRLQEIGAGELEPVIEEVADVVGESLESLSAQTEQISQLYSVSFSADKDPREIVNILAQEDPNIIEYVEPNYVAGIAGKPGYIPAPFDPDDQYFRFQWHMQTIQMAEAWNSSSGEGVIVAVVDTGIDFNTRTWPGQKRLPGYDFVNNDSDPTDDQSHGTHVAGTIAQSTNNGVGVAGVAYDAELLPVKVLGSDGNGSYANIIKGITYAVNQGAKVINLSLAGRNGSQALREAVQYAHSRGVVVVAAAGNSNSSVEFPAAYDDFVIAVGATRFDNTRARYSNTGPEIDLVAPGGDIDVDQNGDSYADGILQQTFKTPGSGYTYLFFEGTSMASPHVAGLSALLLSRKPDASPAEIEALMAQSARNLGSPNEFGAGLIQAADALAAVVPLPVPATDTPTPQPPTDTPTLEPPTDTPTLEPPTDTPTPGPVPATNTPTPVPVPATDTPTPTPQPPTATPTATEPPTATPTPALPPGELLLNGDFETDGGWIIYDTPVDAEYDTSVVNGGSRSIKLGTTTGPDLFSYTSIRQLVTIPAEAGQVTLTADIYQLTQDESSDAQVILILGSSGRILKRLARDLSDSQSWETRSFDLSDLSGETIFVYFGVYNRGGSDKPTAMYVDNVSLSWSP